MSKWINTKFNDFKGIAKDTRKAPIGSFEIVRNLDLREKSGDLVLRQGYDIKYNAISSTILTSKKLSNVQYLGATSFWVDANGGQEITVQLLKHRVTAQTTLSPNYLDMLGIWIRPYWNGSAWIDEWQWLNEVVITKIMAVNISGYKAKLDIYYQTSATKEFYDYTILQYASGLTNYEVPSEASRVLQSEDEGYTRLVIHDNGNAWAINDRVILMRNYFPPKVLKELYNCTADEIVFHKVLDELRIGFGAKENRLAMAIGYVKKYWTMSMASIVDQLDITSTSEVNIVDKIILTPYNTITDYENYINVAVTKNAGTPSLTNVKYFYKIIGLLDGYQRFELASGDFTPSGSQVVEIQLNMLLGIFNRRLTNVEVYVSQGNSTSLTEPINPYYLIESKVLSIDEWSAATGIEDNNSTGFAYVVSYIDKTDIDEASEEMPDKLGYNLPADYVRSWDYATNIDDKTYIFNGYIEQLFSNLIFFSEVSGSSANMPDVICNSFFDVQEFDGDNGLAIVKSPAGYLGVWSNNKFQLLNTTTGVPIGLGTIYKGAVSKRSVVNLGQELVWASEYEITHNRGYQIVDVSEGMIRGDYRAITDKTAIIAVREEKGNAYRFFNGVDTEYILTQRGWQEQKLYHQPQHYMVRKNGEVWYMKDGVIYYPTGYQDRKDSGSYSSISFLAKSMPIDIRLLDNSITHTDRIYVHAFYVNSSTTPIGATFKVYLDGVLFSTKTISQLSDMFYRIPQGANCKEFQFEIAGNCSSAFAIYSMGILWKPISTGAIHGRNH